MVIKLLGIFMVFAAGVLTGIAFFAKELETVGQIVVFTLALVCLSFGGIFSLVEDGNDSDYGVLE